MQVGLNNIHMYIFICIKNKNKNKNSKKTFNSNRVNAVVVFVCQRVSVRTSRRREIHKVRTLAQHYTHPPGAYLQNTKLNKENKP